MINIICDSCGKSFLRKKSEVNRNQKLGRKIFCSRICAGKSYVSNFGKKRNINGLKKGSKRDEYSPFRNLLKSAMGHCAERLDNREISINLEDLKIQWEKQKGICPYTGWKLKLPETTRHKLEKTIDRASLDRIDSSLGYVSGNVQFISLISQYAKNDWNSEVIFEFCKAVVENNI